MQHHIAPSFIVECLPFLLLVAPALDIQVAGPAGLLDWLGFRSYLGLCASQRVPMCQRESIRERKLRFHMLFGFPCSLA